MENSSESYSPEDRLRELHNFFLQSYPGAQNRWAQCGLQQSSLGHTPLGDLEHYVQATLSGQMPDPAVLVRIALGFEKYLQQTSKGGISLDEALGLLGKKREGNPAQKANRDRARNEMFFDIFMLRVENPSISIEGAISQVMKERGLNQGEESWKTRYVNSSWRKLEDITREKGFSFDGNL